MTKRARRKQRAEKLAAAIAAGTYRARPRRSHYQIADIRDAVQADITEMRRQIAARHNRQAPELVPNDVRHVTGEMRSTGWAYVKPTERPPLTLVELEP